MACNYKKYLNGTQIITFQFYKPPLSCYSKATFHEMHIIIPVFTGKFQKIKLVNQFLIERMI